MTTIVEAGRYHDFSYGHRVAGHESKCALLHGHNGRVHFDCQPVTTVSGSTRHAELGLDIVGRVLDFSTINTLLCQWLEVNWDHKFLAWEKDPVMKALYMGACSTISELSDVVGPSIVWLPFNPTAENMADWLLNVVAPQQLQGSGVYCRSVTMWETRKCYTVARLSDE